MSLITVRTRNGEYHGELFPGFLPDTIWLSLPKKLTVNMLGGMIYCECPVDCPVEGELITKLETGDIAYWPKAEAICFFFGPTPLSGDDGEPVTPYPVIRIGRLRGDISSMEDAGDRQRLSLERAFSDDGQ